MAINRVYFFIAILCIALVLHPGGARRYEEIMSDDITTDCFDTPECPLSNESCLQRCERRGFLMMLLVPHFETCFKFSEFGDVWLGSGLMSLEMVTVFFESFDGLLFLL
ncbi:unnamed protein product [Vicia faba]|uniref:Uncharacterized protein n=1 Tax=Vicia faba TaxID=3906 RepID=A0AAV0Z9T9_VICFA|nr:unnamed protein product [Vicia faba]